MNVVNDDSPPHRSQRKRLLYWGVIIATPIVFLAAVEGLLRAFSPGPVMDLIVPTQIRGRAFLSVNPAVGKRYFTQAGIAVPEPPDGLFHVIKSPSIKRIFCMGESTMEGFPYEYNATPPSFLQARLQSMLPRDTVEVINLGISAIGSTVVRDLLPEVLARAPDLIVVYVGHNEYYGVFGPASAATANKSPWLVRFHLSLLRFRTYVVLRDALGSVTRALSPSGASDETTLMQRMVGETAIPFGSETYHRGLDLYRDNILAIINAAADAEVPLLFATPVSNLRDLPPFGGTFAPATPDSLKQQWSRWREVGAERLASGEIGGSITALRSALLCDSTHALGHYTLGRALDKAGNFAEAMQHFQRAKDLDQVRFRAPEDLNSMLLDLCHAHGVAVARLDSAFAANAVHGIPGNDLFLEHVHPTIGGYALMARTLAESIRLHNLLPTTRPWNPALPDTAYLRLCGVSPFDTTLASLKIGMLKRHWPFAENRADQERNAQNAGVEARDTLTSIIRTALEQRIPWTTTRRKVAEWYARRREYGNARRECVAITRATPYAFQPWVLMGDYSASEGNIEEAKDLYEHSLRVEANPYAHMKLGVLYIQGSRPAEAVQEFESGFRVSTAMGGMFTTAEHATGRYLAGLAYAQSGKRREAVEQLKHALALQPGMKEAEELLHRLP